MYFMYHVYRANDYGQIRLDDCEKSKNEVEQHLYTQYINFSVLFYTVRAKKKEKERKK